MGTSSGHEPRRRSGIAQAQSPKPVLSGDWSSHIQAVRAGRWRTPLRLSRLTPLLREGRTVWGASRHRLSAGP